jgi:ABC-type uncharacterized transport system substrate-binding protein
LLVALYGSVAAQQPKKVHRAKKFVGMRLVESLARPGGNVTGITNLPES